MKKMINIVFGIILIIMGYSLLFGIINSTNHYIAEVNINSEIISILVFSTVNNKPLTTDFLKRKFDYKSNDKLIILDIKCITSKEKSRKIEELKIVKHKDLE